MKIDLLYGKNGLTLELPENLDVSVIRKHPMKPVEDPVKAVCHALEHPVGAPPLAEMARGKKTACILICDVTRPVPNGTLLPPIIDTLTRAGMSLKNILILVATVLHRPNEGEEPREIIGSDRIFETVPIKNHFARDRSAHVELGTTANGIPMCIDRRFAQTELKTREEARIDEWQTEMLVKAVRRGAIHLFTTGLSGEEIKATFVNPVSSVAKAVRDCVNKHNDNRVAVVPEGPYVAPRIHPHGERI